MAERGGHSRRVVDDGGGSVPRSFAVVQHGLRAGGAMLPAGVRRAGAVTVAVMLALAGCTGTAAPVPSAPGTPGIVFPGPTTTPSPSPSAPAPPQRPAAMDRDDAEGATAAATYFIALYSYVYATGELGEWQAISDPGCVFCQSVRDDKLAASSRGERSEGGSISIDGTAMSSAGSEPTTFQVDAAISQVPYRTFGPGGNVIDDHPAQSGRMTLALRAVRGTWQVTAVSTKQSTP